MSTVAGLTEVAAEAGTAFMRKAAATRPQALKNFFNVVSNPCGQRIERAPIFWPVDRSPSRLVTAYTGSWRPPLFSDYQPHL